MTDFDRHSLHQFLTGRYDLEGLKTLCHYLDVDYDNLDGRTKESLARELVRYMERVGRVGELVGLQGKETQGARPANEDSLLGPLPTGERGSAPNLTRCGSHTLDSRIHRKTGVELIRIPAGPFLFGSDEHSIYLPEYWIGRYPVTVGQFKRFKGKTGHVTGQERLKDDALWLYPYGKDASTQPVVDNHPVVWVDWQDAKAFADWAGLLLPTEEQWEKAARGMDGRIWPWGNEWIEDRANTSEARNLGTTPVGKYSPAGDSPYGCADMSGNVWEWTCSTFTDEKGKVFRVLRGGSMYDDQWAATTLASFITRISAYGESGDEQFGFRVIEINTKLDS